MTDKERGSLEAMHGSMHERRAAVQRELRNNGYSMSPAMKAQLQQEEAALERQAAAISRRLADEAAGDVLAASERDRTANLEGWAASLEARAGGNRPAATSVNGQIATCAGAELPPGAPEWVMLMPAGQLEARDGRRWRLTDADAVIRATRAAAGSLDLAIDFEHQTQNAKQNGQPAPAAGWIRELQARAGALWARVEWTARAAAMLKAREYRYLSPVFFHTPSGAVARIEGAGLTNYPALDMPALASLCPLTSEERTARSRAISLQAG